MSLAVKEMNVRNHNETLIDIYWNGPKGNETGTLLGDTKDT